MALAGQRLARRRQRHRLARLQRRHLRDVEHRNRPEQHPRARLALDHLQLRPVRLAILDRHRRHDPDRALAPAHAIPELQPRPKPGHERRLRTGQRDQQLVRKRIARQAVAGAHPHPALPPLRRQQLLRRLLHAFAVLGATLLALGIAEVLAIGHLRAPLSSRPAGRGPTAPDPHAEGVPPSTGTARPGGVHFHRQATGPAGPRIASAGGDIGETVQFGAGARKPTPMRRKSPATQIALAALTESRQRAREPPVITVCEIGYPELARLRDHRVADSRVQTSP